MGLFSGRKDTINLTPEFYSALDAEISFDGNYILFSGKQQAGDYWQIWRMKLDGSEKIQITKEAGDCIMPVYAGNRFYLNDPEPTPQIIYCSAAHNWKNNIESGSVYSLYGTDLKGKTVHRLTFNIYSDFSPDVLPNGRIVFSSLQFSEKENFTGGKLAFFAINNDGTDLMPFYGNHDEPGYKNDIHISDMDHRLYFIESQSTDMLGGGNISYISQQRPLHSYQKISTRINGYYHSPCPLPGGGLLASFRSHNKGEVYALYKINPQTGELDDLLFKIAGWHSLDTQILAAHPKAKGRSNWLIPGEVNGVFYCLDSYQTNFVRNEGIKRGDFKFVRIIEGLPVKNDTTNRTPIEQTSASFQSTPARIVGVAPVEPDGSFHVRVPAETPLTFQMLDENQMAIDRQETWTWVIGNENRGCIGCHEDSELSPKNRLVDAVTKPPADLTHIAERRAVDFKHQIAPLIQKKCATSKCHVSGNSKPNLENKQDEMQSAELYAMFLNPVKGSKKKRYVLPGYAKDSPLVWHIFGKKLTGNNTGDDSGVSQIPLKNLLSRDEKMLVIEWIDLGAHWDLSQADYINSK